MNAPATRSRHPGRSGRFLLVALACLAVCLVAAASAQAAAPGPDWTITAQAAPSYFARGDSQDEYLITVLNQGGASPDGSTITIKDQLPAGVTATSIGAPPDFDVDGNAGANCDLATLTCTATALPPGDPVTQIGWYIQIAITVSVSTNASGTLSDTATVSGGGGASESTSTQTPVSAAAVPFGVSSLQTQVQNSSGDPDTQAGGHPFALTTATTFPISSLSTQGGTVFPYPVEGSEPHDINVGLPPGLIGNPNTTPQCTEADLQAGLCPPESQVGVVQLFFYSAAVTPVLLPIYNMVPPPGQPAEFAFTFGVDNAVPILFHVRTESDYGLTAQLTDIPEVDPVMESVLTLWGSPNDPIHDSLRFLLGQEGVDGATGASSDAPLLPLLDYPTNCESGPLSASATADSWQHVGAFSAPVTSTLPAPTGCDSLTFQPSLSVSEDTSQARQPAGVQVDVHVPQTDAPSSLATPELKNATITFPQGLVINPGSADGLEGCSDAQIALQSDALATCPDGSQIGTVQVTTPLLPGPMSGQIFLGTPQCSPCTNADAQDGKMVRLFIVAQGFGVTIKLAGTTSVDPSTGQLTTTFDQNPQLPFSDLVVTLKGGARAPLANPDSCGTYTTTSDLSPWSSPFTADATPSSSFVISGCGNPDTFSPSFSAGATNPQAGAFSPFTLTFSRSDSDQFFSGLTASLTPGVSAKLAGVPLCSDSDANAGTCPAGSQVGTATIAAGPGSEPLWIPQPGDPQPTVYLTGPYEGAPYGLVVESPAIAGPFNLGTVVVRQALFVDPTTAQVTVVSDPFPTILAGIPLQIRTVSVTMNRPDFTLNPTSCNPMAITGTLTSTGGLVAPVSSHFQVGDCQNLGFSPKLRIALTGKGKTRSGDHPTLTATLTQGSGQANIQSARVALPLSLALDPNNSQHVCNYDVAQAVHGGAVGCPASTIVGSATAVTPLLDQPLTGDVYLVQGIRFNSLGQRIRTLPSLLIPLRGQIALDLRAASSVNGAQQLVTTFSTIPDAPVSKFTLTINGGKKGLLVITGRGRTICSKAQTANSTLGAQSGKSEDSSIKLSTPCGGVHKAKRHGKKHSTKHAARGVLTDRRRT